MVEAAAAAGLWILCEKPLAPTAADARAMVAACKKAKVGLGTAFPCRWAPPLAEAKAKIVSGALGEVRAVTCTNHGQAPGGWFADPALSGGGATMDHTVHVADLLRWMLGREFTKVYCELGNQLHRGELATDDIGSVHPEMTGGVQEPPGELEPPEELPPGATSPRTSWATRASPSWTPEPDGLRPRTCACAVG